MNKLNPLVEPIWTKDQKKLLVLLEMNNRRISPSKFAKKLFDKLDYHVSNLWNLKLNPNKENTKELRDLKSELTDEC